MDTNSKDLNIDSGHPLRVESALENDKLGRAEFAKSVVNTLRQVSNESGLVISIEGAWGSGKTSILAMMQALLKQWSPAPIIIDFNPWLVGDRDTLLRGFLSRVASKIKLDDSSKSAKKAAKQLTTYAKVFDVLKLVPGAEPWASVVKGFIESAGTAVGAIADSKTPDIEEQKARVESALRKLDRPIIIFIDDMDRLFPTEVFEMIRIIKAIGDFPNTGYVLAWDKEYISSALKAAKIPLSRHYLDKIVQVRSPIPVMTMDARAELFDEAMSRLPPESKIEHFPEADRRMSMLYWRALAGLLEYPRDFSRVLNVASTIEQSLRGEIVLADIIGISALMVKSPETHALLTKNPEYFSGEPVLYSGQPESGESFIEKGSSARAKTYNSSGSPEKIRGLVGLLFPLTDSRLSRMHQIRAGEGHIAEPQRLKIFLQQQISCSTPSLVMASRYILNPDQRPKIAISLKNNNCLEFLQGLADISPGIDMTLDSAIELCTSIAELIDTSAFINRERTGAGANLLSVRHAATNTISIIITHHLKIQGKPATTRIMESPKRISMAVEIFSDIFLSNRNTDEEYSKEERRRTSEAISDNILTAANDDKLFSLCSPGFVLWRLPDIATSKCAEVLSALREHDPLLDRFVTTFIASGRDSHGAFFKMPAGPEKLDAYISSTELRDLAKQRLQSSDMDIETRSAWRCILEGRAIYSDGQYADR